MAESSPAGRARVVQANRASTTTRTSSAAEAGLSAAPLRPDQYQGKPRRQKPPRKPLSERLPEGVYEARPRQKRYVLHWLYFWAWARLGLYKAGLPVPRPAVREQIKRNFAELFELGKTRQPVVACLNSKGGAGKTALATWLAVLIKLATLRTVVAVDANENKGGTAARLGIDREKTVQLRTFLRFEKELSTAAAINQALASHVGSGVLVIASEAADKTYFSQKLFERRMTTLHQQGHTLMLDVGNGIPHAANRGSVAIADVLVFPATTMQADSFEDAEDTRVRYAANEQHYGFTEKVERGLIVLLGVSEKERLEHIDHYGWKPDRVFRVPKDRFMIGKHVVTWRRINRRTQLALSEIAVEILRTAPVVRPWNEQADETQHMGELNLTEVQYAHSEELPLEMPSSAL